MKVALTKMHGTQNDFVLVDARERALADPAAFARLVCDRHVGVGADGLIVLGPSALADVRMQIFNADGSEAEMCGNGIRCAARWLDEAGFAERVRFETLAGPIETAVEARAPEFLVRVTLGVPRIQRLELRGETRVASVDLGNPHVVIFNDDVDAVDLTRLARGIQASPRFAGGTNVHVAALDRDVLQVRHWERGVGLTRACGTGAVAAAAVAIADGLLTSPVAVDVPGGRLSVAWDGVGSASLTGPAVRVFDTVIDERVAVAF